MFLWNTHNLLQNLNSTTSQPNTVFTFTNTITYSNIIQKCRYLPTLYSTSLLCVVYEVTAIVCTSIIVFLKATSCSLGGTILEVLDVSIFRVGDRYRRFQWNITVYQKAQCHSPKNYVLCIYCSTTKIYFFDFTSETRQPLFLYRICNIRCPYFWILTFRTVNQHFLNIFVAHFFQDLNIFHEGAAQIVPLILYTPHTCCICPLIKHCRRYLKPHTHFKHSKDSRNKWHIPKWHWLTENFIYGMSQIY